MKLPRRTFLKFAGAIATALPRIATAQTYPTRPITLIVPEAALRLRSTQPTWFQS
jgi:tripartite-type tricarboxylate transporter receptor subunit TctC